MRKLILPCCLILAGGSCDPEIQYVPVEKKVPAILLEPVSKPSRPLVIYKDAILRDHERGIAIDQANRKIQAIAKIIGGN
ncbi:hypothetical protein KX928_23410 [Roseobacter sp. YSTF-M11]|uniref:Lipoprotein n=1 Tax=Roseobacter insulae TaxID=2859783 RepID=A0A9X1G0M8_9RHOB|nr:hypothetical protein [Roseobacter insulae]MBW4710749.1 hypothetical protein [Roseobacter insulae]